MEKGFLWRRLPIRPRSASTITSCRPSKIKQSTTHTFCVLADLWMEEQSFDVSIEEILIEFLARNEMWSFLLFPSPECCMTLSMQVCVLLQLAESGNAPAMVIAEATRSWNFPFAFWVSSEGDVVRKLFVMREKLWHSLVWVILNSHVWTLERAPLLWMREIEKSSVPHCGQARGKDMESTRGEEDDGAPGQVF
jgi:hypothetical protein